MIKLLFQRLLFHWGAEAYNWEVVILVQFSLKLNRGVRKWWLPLKRLRPHTSLAGPTTLFTDLRPWFHWGLSVRLSAVRNAEYISCLFKGRWMFREIVWTFLLSDLKHITEYQSGWTPSTAGWTWSKVDERWELVLPMSSAMRWISMNTLYYTCVGLWMICACICMD